MDYITANEPGEIVPIGKNNNRSHSKRAKIQFDLQDNIEDILKVNIEYIFKEIELEELDKDLDIIARNIKRYHLDKDLDEIAFMNKKRKHESNCTS